jgi:putative spermidine/putrescine transport system ATP-binding protein
MVTERASFETVSVRSATRTYGLVKALDNVSLEVKAGEFVSLLGPSGSGKTTILNVLGGFTHLTSGRVLFGNRDVTLLQPHLRNIGVVFQSYALFPHMNVAQNVAFPLRARGVSKADCLIKVREALALVELSGYEERRINQLSGGQRQRVALARAIVFEPGLILLDEPLSALDKQLRETMQIEIRRLHARLGATMIYVTHDQREALTMSDRIAVMRAGRIEQIDAPRKLHDFPANDFVANFVGETTLLRVNRGPDNSLTLGNVVLRTTRDLPTANRLAIAIHAEKLILGPTDENEGWNRLPGIVTEVIYQGESVKVFVKLAADQSLSFRLPCHHMGTQSMPQIGNEITLSLHIQDTIVVPVLEPNISAPMEGVL